MGRVGISKVEGQKNLKCESLQLMRRFREEAIFVIVWTVGRTMGIRLPSQISEDGGCFRDNKGFILRIIIPKRLPS